MERLNLDKVKIMAAAATLAMFAGTACAHLEVYGQVNKVYLQAWNDQQDAGIFGDNNYSPSKLGVMSSAHLNKCLTFGGVTELEFVSNNTRLVSQIQTEDPQTRIVFVRKLDAWASYGSWGKLYLGLGHSASWGITDLSYAGTNETSLGSSVENNAGGMIFNNKGTDATFLDPRVRRVFNALNGAGDIEDYDGLLSTLNRVRVDFGDWMGFKLGVSYGNVNRFIISDSTAALNSWDSNIDGGLPTRKTYLDVALRYAACWDDFMVSAGVAGVWYHGMGDTSEPEAPSVTGSLDDEDTTWSGSIAVEHRPSGFNVAVAGGVRDKFVEALDDYNFWYVQLGKHFCFTHYGKTHVAIDYFQGKHARVNDDKGRSYSVGVTQDLCKANTAVYASVRSYKYEDVPGHTYDSITAGTLGVLFKFGAML